MRPLRFILVCVLLGAVTTVGVAWGVAAVDRGGLRDDLGEQRGYRVRARIGSGVHAVSVAMKPEVWVLPDPPSPPTVSAVKVWNDFASSWPVIGPNSGTPLSSAYQFAFGWPFVAIMYESGFYGDSLAGESHDRWVLQGPNALWKMRVSRYFPLRPIPLGFTVDTIFYGSIWFGLIMCPGFVRRKIRQRRGLCPSCGYDMHGDTSGTCPECGTRVEGVVG